MQKIFPNFPFHQMATHLSNVFFVISLNSHPAVHRVTLIIFCTCISLNYFLMAAHSQPDYNDIQTKLSEFDFTLYLTVSIFII